jgi:hypothetical protein
VTTPIQSSSPDNALRSRRALLAGALGGMGAMAASAIGHARPARAGVDGDVVLGGSNLTTQQTSIANPTNGANTMLSISSSGGNAIFATTDVGDAVIGISSSSDGVVGIGGDRGVVGSSANGWAGYFSGKVFTSRFIEFAEMGNPPIPRNNSARLFVRDSAGQTQLCVRFHNGKIRVLATA